MGGLQALVFACACVCLAILVVPAQSFKIESCSGDKNGHLESIAFSNCDAEKDPVCRFVRGSNATVSGAFKLKRRVTELRLRVLGKKAIFKKFLLERNVCPEVKCPIEANETRKFSFTIPVKRSYPKISATLILELNDEKRRNLLCVRFPISIVDGRVRLRAQPASSPMLDVFRNMDEFLEEEEEEQEEEGKERGCYIPSLDYRHWEKWSKSTRRPSSSSHESSGADDHGLGNYLKNWPKDLPHPIVSEVASHPIKSSHTTKAPRTSRGPRTTKASHTTESWHTTEATTKRPKARTTKRPKTTKAPDEDDYDDDAED